MIEPELAIKILIWLLLVAAIGALLMWVAR